MIVNCLQLSNKIPLFWFGLLCFLIPLLSSLNYGLFKESSHMNYSSEYWKQNLLYDVFFFFTTYSNHNHCIDSYRNILCFICHAAQVCGTGLDSAE